MLRCVSRVYTEYATFDIDPDRDGVDVRETFGISVAALAQKMDIEVIAR